MDIKTEKTRARLQAKARREQTHDPAKAAELILYFPAVEFRGQTIGGYWPLPGEIDIRPLLGACHEAGHRLALPCTPRKGHPLTFRAWSPGDKLKAGPYNTYEPYTQQAEIFPDLVLMPLLSFTAIGERLGYGGGFYDRTLARLRDRADVFACGVAYAAQEAAILPTDQNDYRLDGILTETGYKAF